MTLLDDKQLEKSWIELSDIPFDENKNGELVLAEKWLHFEEGTEREIIWGWFDENHSKGVHYLMFEMEEEE